MPSFLCVLGSFGFAQQYKGWDVSASLNMTKKFVILSRGYTYCHPERNKVELKDLKKKSIYNMLFFNFNCLIMAQVFLLAQANILCKVI